MPNFISKVKLPDDSVYDIKSRTTQGILRGSVASTSTASAFTATIADLTASTYYDGLTVMLSNGVVTAGSSFTLNVNGLGAKTVVSNSVSTNQSSLFIQNSTMIFVYDSTLNSGNGGWYCYHGVDNVDGMYYVAGSGSTASKTSNPYYAARWRGNNPSITTLYSGLCINYKLDVAGNGTYGTVLSINGGPEHPVCANVNSMVSTRYAVGCIIPLVYDATQTANAYINSASASTITGCWKIADYDTNTVTQTVVRDFIVGKNAGILYRYQICMVDENDGLVPFNNVNNGPSNYTKATNTASFDPFRGLYWYCTTAAINPGAGASIGSNVMYLVYQQDARYSFNLNSGVASSQVAATQGATVYSTSYKYAVGSYCTYAGELYKCKTAITTAGAWDASKWTKITAYSSTSTYAVNDECIHSGYVWKCTTAIGSGGEAWNAAHWTYTTMTGMISSYPVYIKAKYNKTTHLATLVGDTTSTSYLVRSSITHGLPEENPNTGLSTNEIYIYIFVGRSYTCYNLGMFATHPVYYWNDVAGKATIFSGAEEAVVPTKTSDLLNDGEDGTSEYVEASDLATVATTGDYSDLIGLPTIPSAPGTLTTTSTSALSPTTNEALSGSVSLHKVSKTGSYNDLLNKPTIPEAELFECEYGVTEFADMIAAQSSGKALYCYYNNVLYWSYGDSTYLWFYALYDQELYSFGVGYDGENTVWSNFSFIRLSDGRYNRAWFVNTSTAWSEVYQGALDYGSLPLYYDATHNVVCYMKYVDSNYTMHFLGEDASNYYEITLAYDDTWSSVTITPKTSGTVTNIATGSGLTGGPISTTGTISHADTSTQASSTNSGRTYIQSVGLDDFGHVTSLSTATETVTDTNTTYTLSGGLSSHKFTSTLTAGGSGSGTSTAELTLAAGSNVSLTDDTTNKKITIAATDTTYTFANGTNGFTVTPSGGSAQTVTITPSVNASSQLTGIVPLTNGGTGIDGGNAQNWYNSDALHPRFEVLYDIEDGGFQIKYTGPLDGISDIADFRASDYFKAAVRSLVPMWVGNFGGTFFSTAMVMTGMLAESDISKIYILFPDAVLYYGQYVNGLKGTLVYDANDGVYILPSSMEPLSPAWLSALSYFVMRSDLTSVTASHVTSGTSFSVYNSGGVVSQTSFSSSNGFTVAEGTVTAVSCYSGGGAVSQTAFGTASITPYTVTDVTAVNLT